MIDRWQILLTVVQKRSGWRFFKMTKLQFSFLIETKLSRGKSKIPDNEFTLLLGMRIEKSTKQHADGFRREDCTTVTANRLKQEESLQRRRVCTYLTSSTLCTNILVSSCITHQLHFLKSSPFSVSSQALNTMATLCTNHLITHSICKTWFTNPYYTHFLSKQHFIVSLSI